jgi:hypothetical protein
VLLLLPPKIQVKLVIKRDRPVIGVIVVVAVVAVVVVVRATRVEVVAVIRVRVVKVEAEVLGAELIKVLEHDCFQDDHCDHIYVYIYT